MKRFYIVGLILFALSQFTVAQTTVDYAVQLTATVQTSPPTITLSWTTDSLATGYNIFRKAKEATTWGTAVANLGANTSTYVDNNVAVDTAYEYRVQKMATGYTGYGYIYAGIDKPATHNRGTLLLLVDSLFNDSLATEVVRLMDDMRGNGWALEKFVIGRNALVVDVKATIVNAYNDDPQNVRAVLLLGHIPVPYSGDINPDGHGDHLGAWGADVFYADMDGSWTDNIVNDSLASRPENHNKIGDGKYDQSYLPSNVELQISRIDVANMPAFGESEVIIMKRYLDKDHAYRQGLYNVQHRGLVDDNFGAFGGEAFAVNSWRNFSPLVNTTTEADFITTLKTESYQWAYGCGGGWFQGAGGVGNTNDFVNDTAKTIFTMLFGSYFGDWDSQDNFLRAPLCAKDPALTCCWAGRPHWFFHHMALGDNIGYSTKLSQNLPGNMYYANYGGKMVHVALMGDLTLEEFVVLPPSNLTLSIPDNDYGATLNWTASNDTTIGYYVYRGDEVYGQYQLISDLLTTTTFTDTVGTNGLNYYMVRAAKHQLTPSGTFINLSEGIVDSMQVTFVGINDVSKSSFNLYPVPTNDRLYVSVTDNGENHWNVIDATGRTILEGENTNNFSIDVSKLATGVYTLRLTNNNISEAKHFEVVR